MRKPTHATSLARHSAPFLSLLFAFNLCTPLGEAQSGQVSNLRFLDLEQNLSSIGPGAPAPGLKQGDLLGEFQFQSDQLDQATGTYTYSELGVLWKIESEGEVIHMADPTIPGWEWLGANQHQEVLVTDFDTTTGVGTARLDLPIGQSLEESGPASALTPYPHLPEDVALTAVVGWKGRLGLSAGGSPLNVLETLTATFDVAWPDVYITSGDFISEIGTTGSPRTVMVCLKEKVAFNRVFDLSVRPSHRATLVNTSVTILAGEGFVEAQFIAESPGPIQVTALEGGTIAAESDRFSIVPLLFMQELGASSGFAIGASSGATGMTQAEFESANDELDKLCIEEYTGGGPSQPTYTWCTPCTNPPSLDCPGEPAMGQTAPPMIIYRPAACTGDPSECFLVLEPPAPLYTYRFSSSVSKICKTITQNADVSTKPFGVGGGTGTSTTQYWYNMCCKYVYDPSTPSGVTTNGQVCGGS